MCNFLFTVYAAYMRVLGRTRLSRSSEESTSIERQKEIIEGWAKANDHEIIGWADDVGVSGGIDPFETPALGPWLTDEHIDEWDILCSWKMDRLARRTVPLHRLMGFIQDNDKVMVCVSDNIDLSHWVGRLVASVIAGVAEGELEAIRERNQASHKKLREIGRWHGGRPPFGYVPVELDAGGWTFDHDPEAVKLLRRIIEEVMDGKTINAIVNELNEAGVPTPSDYHRKMRGLEPRGKLWHGTVLTRALRSPTLMGWATHEKRAVRDETGKPIMKGPPIIERDQFDKLQEILDSRKVNHRTRQTSPLMGIVFCWDCGGPMHYRYTQKVRRRGEYYGYYYCPDKCQPQTNGEELVTKVYSFFEQDLGEYQQMEKKIIRANDNSDRIKELGDAIADLASMVSTLSADGRARVLKQISTLDAELAKLEEEHSTETEVEWVPTGRKYIDLWNEADTEGKRQIMLKAGIKVLAKPDQVGSPRTGRGTVDFLFRLPPDLHDRLR